MQSAFRAVIACLLFWLPQLHAADSGWVQSPHNTHVKVRFQAYPSDTETQLLLSVSLEKNWKTYWRSPGEGGVPPVIEWQKGTTSAQWFWPTPSRFDVAGLTTQGYHDDVTFPIVIQGKSPASLSGTLTLPTCSNVCILTDFPFRLDLSSVQDPTDFSQQFTIAMGQIPITQGLVDSASAAYRQGSLLISATRAQGWQSPALFIDGVEGSAFGKPLIKMHGEQLSVTVPVTDEWGDVAGDISGKEVSLVLADRGMAQQLALPIGQIADSTGDGIALWQVALMALAGGLILNMMPCVMPVLGMKLGSILQVEQRDRKSVRMQFFASSAGIITSFLALALLMTVLRYADQTLGWGIQFQNPWFIGVMVVVTALFTANLLGLFEINLSSGMTTRIATQKRSGLAGNFAEGAFATLLATPCSAPFLGTAVAFALAAPLPVLWGLFLMLGIGMSLPWWLIALWPGLAMSLPRPGRWMLRLRVALGVLMLAACLWLLSLMQNHLSIETVIGIALMILLALVVGSLRRYGGRNTAVVLCIGMLLGGLLMLIAAFFFSGNSRPLQDAVNWQPLSEQAIKDALTEHKVVFIDVTADWCVTCKANKFNVLLRDDVQKALSDQQVVALRGDWSRPSKSIDKFLQMRGSIAVPFNQIYGPGMTSGEILSPLLTRDAVLQGLKNAQGDKQ
ncbi:protein-disulfide reductase DsbD family protein [Ewingella sp. S1.OA.A_B6]